MIRCCCCCVRAPSRAVLLFTAAAVLRTIRPLLLISVQHHKRSSSPNSELTVPTGWCKPWTQDATRTPDACVRTRRHETRDAERGESYTLTKESVGAHGRSRCVFTVILGRTRKGWDIYCWRLYYGEGGSKAREGEGEQVRGKKKKI